MMIRLTGRYRDLHPQLARLRPQGHLLRKRSSLTGGWALATALAGPLPQFPQESSAEPAAEPAAVSALAAFGCCQDDELH